MDTTLKIIKETSQADIATLLSVLNQVAALIGSGTRVIQLDYVEGDLSTVAGDVVYADRTVVAAELFNSKDGTSGEIDSIDLIIDVDYVEDAGAANGLDLTTATHNQWVINIGALGEEDLLLTMGGSRDGQHVAGDFQCPANGGGHASWMVNISDLTNSTLKDNILQNIEVRLENGRSLDDNLRLRVGTYLKITYNSDAG